jgi:dTMP kinase
MFDSVTKQQSAHFCQRMKKGFFIVIEGPNRAGKTTLIRELADHLKALVGEVIVTREPGGTPMGEGLRAVLKNSAMAGGTFATALVFNGGRKEHADKVITPARNRGAVILCDRYYISTEIFQGVLARDVTSTEREILRSIHRSLPQPDLTIFVLPTAEVVAKRGAGHETDRFEGDSRELAAYEEYARQFTQSNPTLVIRPTLGTEGKSKLSEILSSHLLPNLGQR